MSAWTSYNGLINTIAYDSALRPTSISVPNVESLAFSYDAADRITKLTNGLDSSMTQTFGYDSLNRLINATSGADHESFSYDANGNRLNAVINGVTWTYTTSSTSNRLVHASNGSWSGPYQYDANGNTLGTTHQYWTYDAFNRMRTAIPLASSPVTTYDVSAEDQRLRKYTSSTGTYFAPDSGGALSAEYLAGAWQDYVQLNGRLVAVIKGGAMYPVHTDQTGRPEAITDASHSILWRARNLAFSRSVTTNVWGDFNLGFPGQYYDNELGKWHNGHRDYDATLGRYLESDPIGLAGGVNTYAYVGNNPISWIDPLGLKLCSTTLPGLGKTYLDSSFYPLVQNWVNANSAAGISVRFTSAFRTTAHQANMGAGAITPAAPGHSLHEAGFAVDISWSSLSATNQATALQNAGTSGLSWGGNFRHPDPVHFYDDPGNRTQYIQAAQKDYQNGSASACKCGS